MGRRILIHATGGLTEALRSPPQCCEDGHYFVCPLGDDWRVIPLREATAEEDLQIVVASNQGPPLDLLSGLCAGLCLRYDLSVMAIYAHDELSQTDCCVFDCSPLRTATADLKLSLKEVA